MNRIITSTLICATALFAVPDTAMAHGGRYRGPGDVVPPNPGRGGGSPGPTGPTTPGGPGGPSTGGPGLPSSPGPTGPTTGPGPSPGGRPGGPVSGGGGAALSSDLTRWQFWWEFNKDPFLNLKQAIHTEGVTTASPEFFMGAGEVTEGNDRLRPSDRDVLDKILPALKRALDGTSQRDTVSSCMVAMAKIGKDGRDFEILPLLRARLSSKDGEIRETAALAMGISQMTQAIPDLIDLARDTVEGQRLCDRSNVDDRTRTFACYALGLIAHGTSSNQYKTTIADTLTAILGDQSVSSRNIQVGVINALSLIKPNPNHAAGKALLNRTVKALMTYYDKDIGTSRQLIQANVPPAIAKLVGDQSTMRASVMKRFLLDLEGKKSGKRSKNEIVQSAIIALGKLAHKNDKSASALDRKVSAALLRYQKKGRDVQARNFALMALGQIGGVDNRNQLLNALEKGSKAMVKPWAALSLGVMEFQANAAMPSRAPDALVGRRLEHWLTELKNDESQAAMAIALGLMGEASASDRVLALLQKYKSRDTFAGYLCISLALMGETRAIAPIKSIAQSSVRRPERLLQAAMALGKLGDKNVTEDLQAMMTEGDPNLAKMSAIAGALGFIGDRRTIQPLIDMLFNQDVTALSRAFAAVALGGVADKEPLRWNSKLAVDMNYRAAVSTLTNQVSGVLDIL